MKHFPPPQRLLLAAAAALALLGTLPAHAIGRLADVQVIDRDTGATMTLHRHQGQYWVAGRPGARYAVSLRNRSGMRVLNVVSVDGVNVVSGETAATDQTGYVLSPQQRYAITGWRKSDSEVAAFHFTASPDSYAARTGRPDHLGVIGVAVFREKAPAPPAVAPLFRERPGRYGMPESGDAPAQERGSAADSRTEPSSMAKSRSDNAAQDLAESGSAPRRAPAAAAPRLGTGHGARENDWVGHTRFERRSAHPDELIRIRYDSMENLVAMGIVPMRPTPPRPHPFPGTTQPGYAPDPG